MKLSIEVVPYKVSLIADTECSWGRGENFKILHGDTERISLTLNPQGHLPDGARGREHRTPAGWEFTRLGPLSGPVLGSLFGLLLGPLFEQLFNREYKIAPTPAQSI